MRLSFLLAAASVVVSCTPARLPETTTSSAQFLAQRPGEQTTRTTPIRLPEAAAAELSNCDQRAGKADPRCAELEVVDLKVGYAQEMERGAKEQMVLIARGLSAAETGCGTAARNPASDGASFGFDGPGWTCLATALTKDERQQLTGTFGHAYSFRVDEKLGVYEVLARGSNGELVLRGKLGEEPDKSALLRR